MPIKKQTAKTVKKPVVKRAKRNTVAKESPKIISFGRAVSNFFKKYAQFSGGATRAEFWWTFLFLALCVFVIVFVASLIAASFTQSVMTEAGLVIDMNPWAKAIVLLPVALFYLATIVPWYALMSRRLHNAGITAKLLWINVALGIYALSVPWVLPGSVFVSWFDMVWTIALFILFVFPAKTKNNPYCD